MNIKHKLICIFEKVLSVVLPLKKQVIFESFHGKQYSDNPRAVSEKLHELDSTYKIVWIFRDTSKNRYNDIPDYVKVVKKWSLPYFINLVSSCAIVTNEAFDTNIYKRDKQYFVQTWHGDRVFKKSRCCIV